jgi:hypothetical protein
MDARALHLRRVGRTTTGKVGSAAVIAALRDALRSFWRRFWNHIVTTLGSLCNNDQIKSKSKSNKTKLGKGGGEGKVNRVRTSQVLGRVIRVLRAR